LLKQILTGVYFKFFSHYILGQYGGPY